MLGDTSFWIWLWLILASMLISFRGYREVKRNEKRKRGDK